MVALDKLAYDDLADGSPILFDDLETWEERSAGEHRISALLASARAAPAVASIELSGHRLIDFAEPRLRLEIARLLRGWTLSRAGAGAPELCCDPAAPAALEMGVRAGMGLDPSAVPYVIPPAIPGSRLKRAAARQVMRMQAAASRPERIRVAAVCAGKLSLLLGDLPDAQLRNAGIGLMPFPGLDHGNGALLALRRRLPMIATLGPTRSRTGPEVSLPGRLELGAEPELDHALTLLLGRLLAGAAPELEGAVRALAGLERARALRALLLPSAAYGASRLLIEWAHAHEVRVGAIQHGIYAFREFDGGDRHADVVFTWGDGTAEQAQDWPAPRPTLVAAGVPGMAVARHRAPANALRRALIATSDTSDTAIAPVAFCETFLEVLAPGLRRLAAAGVELALRPHPYEDPERYRRVLADHDLAVPVITGGRFQSAIAQADILISSASSVAFEAAALGLPVLLWLGPAPRWVRSEHLVVPWVDSQPGMFERAEDFGSLAENLLERPAEAFGVAHELSRSLAHYAQPFDLARFVDGLSMLAA